MIFVGWWSVVNWDVWCLLVGGLLLTRMCGVCWSVVNWDVWYLLVGGLLLAGMCDICWLVVCC